MIPWMSEFQQLFWFASFSTCPWLSPSKSAPPLGRTNLGTSPSLKQSAWSFAALVWQAPCRSPYDFLVRVATVPFFPSEVLTFLNSNSVGAQSFLALLSPKILFRVGYCIPPAADCRSFFLRAFLLSRNGTSHFFPWSVNRVFQPLL